ncbi:MAG: S-adenosylmethionine:tRNA ribosyltransferase-isomerase, partial [Phycisphaerae bacterium]
MIPARFIGRDCRPIAGRDDQSPTRWNPTIKTASLQYELPPESIAQTPCAPRDAARLLVLRRESGEIEHRIFRDLPELLRPNDCLVLNTTRVLPAKFVAHRATGGRIPGLFIRESAAGRWEVMLRGAGRLQSGERLRLGDSRWSMELIRVHTRGRCEVAIDPPDVAGVVLNEIGTTPLPPYIRRGDADADRLDRHDRDRYQTIYADVPGAVAAPTAGMHFTNPLFDALRQRRVSTAEVVLHVGLGTFLPIEVDDLADHPMHSEWFELTTDNAAAIQQARTAGGRVVAVGSTSVRVLESCGETGIPEARQGWTDILIYPPYRFRAEFF